MNAREELNHFLTFSGQGPDKRAELIDAFRAQVLADLGGDTAVEYGTAFQSDEASDEEVHTPTDSREESESRVARYRDMYPTAHLVQRTVHYGPWTEATS